MPIDRKIKKYQKRIEANKALLSGCSTKENRSNIEERIRSDSEYLNDLLKIKKTKCGYCDAPVGYEPNTHVNY